MGASTQAPFTFLAAVRACTHSEVSKLVFSIHWTLSRKFYFLHHPKILHYLKAITDYRNVRAHLRMLRACACRYCSQTFFGASLMPI